MLLIIIPGRKALTSIVLGKPGWMLNLFILTMVSKLRTQDCQDFADAVWKIAAFAAY